MSKAPTHAFDRLFEILQARRSADPETSYTAKLLSRGPDQIGKKLGEEGVEAAIEVVRRDRDKLVSESADLLYHLAVAWVALEVRPEEVWRALEARAGVGGLVEKARRGSSGGK